LWCRSFDVAIEEQDLQLQVLRVDGAILYDQVFSAQSRQNLFQLNLEGLPGGVYFVRSVHEGQADRIWRVVVE
jgi:hypothetical protein